MKHDSLQNSFKTCLRMFFIWIFISFNKDIELEITQCLRFIFIIFAILLISSCSCTHIINTVFKPLLPSGHIANVRLARPEWMSECVLTVENWEWEGTFQSSSKWFWFWSGSSCINLLNMVLLQQNCWSTCSSWTLQHTIDYNIFWGMRIIL